MFRACSFARVFLYILYFSFLKPLQRLKLSTHYCWQISQVIVEIISPHLPGYCWTVLFPIYWSKTKQIIISWAVHRWKLGRENLWEEKVSWVSWVAQKRKGLRERRRRHAGVIAASTMRPACGGAAEDKGKHRCKGRTEKSLSLSVPCSIQLGCTLRRQGFDSPDLSQMQR